MATKRETKKIRDEEDMAALSEPPITIKGGSLKIRYQRSAFKKNPADGEEDQHTDNTRKIVSVEIKGTNKSESFVFRPVDGDCTIEINYT